MAVAVVDDINQEDEVKEASFKAEVFCSALAELDFVRSLPRKRKHLPGRVDTPAATASSFL